MLIIEFDDIIISIKMLIIIIVVTVMVTPGRRYCDEACLRRCSQEFVLEGTLLAPECRCKPPEQGSGQKIKTFGTIFG